MKQFASRCCGFCLAFVSASLYAEELPATGTVAAYFTPWDDVEAEIIKLIDGAQNQIHVQAYLFTRGVLTDALLRAKGRGVEIAMLVDGRNAEEFVNSVQINRLVRGGATVRLEEKFENAHNKVIVIDPPSGALLTGSYNFTRAAQESNAENILIIKGNAPLVKEYDDNWQRHFEIATPYHETANRTSRPK